MRLFDYLLIAIALLGHVVLWVKLFNWLHSLGIRRWWIKNLTKLIFLALISGVVGCGWLIVRQQPLTATDQLAVGPWFSLGYFCSCFVVALVTAGNVLRNGSHQELRDRYVSCESSFVDVAMNSPSPLTASVTAKAFAAIPLNEIFQLEVNEKQFFLPQLSDQLNGLSIAHISDLHMTGDLSQSFFDTVVERTNELNADLVMITGDIVEKNRCLGWIPETLGKLRAEYGVFYVLGNHDKRVPNVERLRETLEHSGIVGINGAWRVHAIQDTPIVLAGNELPWFGPAPDMSDCPEQIDGQRPLRILLSHTPDQITWARENQFDLMLAGHTHGGQIRLPLIGPVISPSRFGVKYASGVFYESPTLMHVSRGVSGLDLIRWNCRPEITKLALQTSE